MTRRLTAPATQGLRKAFFGVSLVAGLAILGGCSFFSHATTWSKNGATEEQAHSDLATCKEQADVQTNRDRGIDQDISTANSGGNAGIDTSPLQNMQSYHDDRRYKSILEDCMAQLGYQKVE
jgi:hypothetical protein